MMKPFAICIAVSANLLGSAAFAELPDKKQANPDRCQTSPGGAAGIATDEEGGPNQHADRPKPKGRALSAKGGPKVSASQNGQTLRHAINTKGTGTSGRAGGECPEISTKGTRDRR